MSKPKAKGGRTTPKGTKAPERKRVGGHAPVLVNARQMAERGIVMGPDSVGAACSCGWMTAVGGDTTVLVAGGPGGPLPERVVVATASDKALAALRDHVGLESRDSDVAKADFVPKLAPPRAASGYRCECGWTPPAGCSDTTALAMFEQHRDGGAERAS